MGRIEDKLNSIFNDDDIDDILGPATTKRAAKRSAKSGVEKNFDDVMTFYEVNNRMPVQDSGNDGEDSAWFKWDGIRKRDDLRALVSHMDQYGLLDITANIKTEKTNTTQTIESLYEEHLDIFNLGSNVSLIENPTHHETTLNDRQHEDDNCPECELKYDDNLDFMMDYYETDIRAARLLIENTINKLKANVEYIGGFEFDWSPCSSCLMKSVKSIKKLSHHLNDIGEALENKCKDLKDYKPKDHPPTTKNHPPTAESVSVMINEPIASEDIGVNPERPKPEKQEECTISQDNEDEKISLDDVFNDDDFDDLLDGANSDNILGGKRAVKAHERDNVEQTNREPCTSFETYRERFEKHKLSMEKGELVVSANRHEALSTGDLFLWDGLIALLSGESIDGDVKEHSGKRLHVVFSNGTEAWLREGSIKRCMYAYSDRGNKVVCKRLVSVTEDLFTEDDSSSADENTITGYIYVARTLSKDPGLAKIRKSAVKIGVTKNPVAVRVANAEKDSTFLCAPVNIVYTFTLHNLNPRKVEETLHAFFGDVRLKIGAKDRFNNDVTANEWFLVSPKVVSSAINHLVMGDLCEFVFNKNSGLIKNVHEKYDE
jgi:hypothetical protein